MDLILEKKDAVQAALHIWRENLLPAVLQYEESSRGKTSTLFSQAQREYEGTSPLCLLCPLVL